MTKTQALKQKLSEQTIALSHKTAQELFGAIGTLIEATPEKRNATVLRHLKEAKSYLWLAVEALGQATRAAR